MSNFEENKETVLQLLVEAENYAAEERFTYVHKKIGNDYQMLQHFSSIMLILKEEGNIKLPDDINVHSNEDVNDKGKAGGRLLQIMRLFLRHYSIPAQI